MVIRKSYIVEKSKRRSGKSTSHLSTDQDNRQIEVQNQSNERTINKNEEEFLKSYVNSANKKLGGDTFTKVVDKFRNANGDKDFTVSQLKSIAEFANSISTGQCKFTANDVDSLNLFDNPSFWNLSSDEKSYVVNIFSTIKNRPQDYFTGNYKNTVNINSLFSDDGKLLPTGLSSKGGDGTIWQKVQDWEDEFGIDSPDEEQSYQSSQRRSLDDTPSSNTKDIRSLTRTQRFEIESLWDKLKNSGLSKKELKILKDNHAYFKSLK